MAVQSRAGSRPGANRQAGQSQPPLGGFRFETGCHWRRHASSDFSDPCVNEKLDGRYSFNETAAAAIISWKPMSCDSLTLELMIATLNDSNSRQLTAAQIFA
jgi:hypothetical protein